MCPAFQAVVFDKPLGERDLTVAAGVPDGMNLASLIFDEGDGDSVDGYLHRAGNAQIIDAAYFDRGHLLHLRARQLLLNLMGQFRYEGAVVNLGNHVNQEPHHDEPPCVKLLDTS